MILAVLGVVSAVAILVGVGLASAILVLAIKNSRKHKASPCSGK